MADSSLQPTPAPQYTPTSTHNMATVTPRAHLYNDPQGLRGAPVQSTVGVQALENAFYIKKVLTETAKKRKFSKMASVTAMPKHMGQKIKQTIFYPLLDDRNLNDQGINARGVQIRNGNMYGSSKDVGRVLGALPVVGEIGGRVNRVGFSRAEVEGTFNKFGFFFEYSDDLQNFDADPQLVSRMYNEAITGAEQINEDMLQIDLLHSAGTVVYAGNAISDATMDHTSVVTYNAIRRLERALDDVRSPRQTKVISGSSNFDTRTATTYRTIFVGSEVLMLLEGIMDPFSGKPAFIHAHQYKQSIGTLFEDEVGIIGKFRVVYVEDMKKWEGAGADADPQYGLASSGGKYDIFPILTIGEDCFTTISFNGSNGINNKFTIIHKKPGAERAGIEDPFGEVGFVSIKWYYGILVTRPERIGLIKTVAPM